MKGDTGMKWMKWGAAAVGALAAAGIVAYAVFWIGGKASAADPPQNAAQYEQLLANQLGISLDKLQAAEKNARNQLIDQLQAQGKITADQATRAKNAPGGFPGFGLFDHGGPRGGAA